MPTVTGPAVLNLARHFAAMGGWLQATSITRDDHDALNALAAGGFVVEGWRGKTPTYELTDTGRAWLATQERTS